MTDVDINIMNTYFNKELKNINKYSIINKFVYL